MTSLNPSLRLALINKAKSKKNILQKGFTLVELMMVIVIVGVLSAVALPNFVGTKSKAQAGAINGSLIGLAKECSTNAALDSPDAVTASSTAGIKFVAGTGGTNCEKGAKMSNDTAFTATEIGGSKCGSDTADGKVDTFCVITVGDNGVTEGTWGSAAAS